MKSLQFIWLVKIVGILAIGLANACGSNHDHEQSLSAIPAIQGELPLLGMGFSSLDAGVTGNNCFTELPIQYQKSRSATVDFYKNLDYESLSRLIDAKIEIGIPVFPGISVKGRVRYADEFAASDYAETMTLRFKAVGESSRVYFDSDRKQPDPSTSLARLAQKGDMNSIRRLCGDQYVSALDKGVEILATLKMEFTDSYARNVYGGGFGAEILGGIIAVDVDVNYEKLMKDAGIKVNLAIEQRGGDPLQLLNVLPSAAELKSSKVSDEPTISFLNCTYESRHLCYEIFRRVTKLANELSAQIKSDESEAILGNMVPLSFEVLDYPKTNSMRLAALGEEEAQVLNDRRNKLEDGRRRLLLIDHDAAEFRRRAENLVVALEGRAALTANSPSPSPMLSDSLAITKLKGIQSRANAALKLVELIRTDCYSYDAIRSSAGVELCLHGNSRSDILAHPGAFGIWDRFYKGDLSISGLDLNLDPQSFTEWCTLGYYPILGNLKGEIPEVIAASDFLTVKALVKMVGAEPTDFYSMRDSCHNLENVLLEKIKSQLGLLNLDHMLLSSVRPLKSLSNITNLSLENNKIEDVTALKDLPKLRQLNLRRNKIRSLAMLRGFASNQLERLDLSRNVIGSGQLENLIGKSDFNWTVINLNGNVIDNIGQLTSSTVLTSLDLRGNPLGDLSGLNNWNTSMGFSLNLCQDKSPVCPLPSSGGGACKIAPATDRYCMRAD